MATLLEQNHKRNERRCKKRRDSLHLDGPARSELEKLKQKLYSLERTIIHSEERSERLAALSEITTEFKRLEKEISSKEQEEKGSNLQELRERLHAHRMSLEQIAMNCDDEEIRNKAFDLIKSDSFAAKHVHRWARFPDIKKRARQALPTKKDRHYSEGKNRKDIT